MAHLSWLSPLSCLFHTSFFLTARWLTLQLFMATEYKLLFLKKVSEIIIYHHSFPRQGNIKRALEGACPKDEEETLYFPSMSSLNLRWWLLRDSRASLARPKLLPGVLLPITWWSHLCQSPTACKDVGEGQGLFHPFVWKAHFAKRFCLPHTQLLTLHCFDISWQPCWEIILIYALPPHILELEQIDE